jgi:hypothetical protein
MCAMADDKKPKVPDFVTKLEKKQKIYNTWVRHRKNYVQDSFDSALKHMQDLYKKANPGADDIDIYDDIGSAAFRKKFMKKFHATIIDKLKDQYRFDKNAKISDNEKDFHDDMVLDLMTGMSRDDLDNLYNSFIQGYKSIVEQAQNNEVDPMTIGEYFSGGNFAQEFVNTKNYATVRRKLNNSIVSHFKDTSIDDLLDYTGLKSFAQREYVTDPFALLPAVRKVAANSHAKISDSKTASELLGGAHKDYAQVVKDKYKSQTDAYAKVDKKYTPKEEKKAA